MIALRFLDGCGSTLNGAAFAPARFLRVLDLSACSIQELPDSIGQLTQLRYLNSPMIQNERIPESIKKLSNLIYLDLHKSSSILALPHSIGEMKGLMHLDLLGCNGITELPFSFRNLENLVHLDLSGAGCYLFDVSESFRSLSRMEHLTLGRCKIIDLAKELTALTALQYLNLNQVHCSGTLCSGLKVMANLTKLRYLGLKSCLDINKVGDDVEYDAFP